MLHVYVYAIFHNPIFALQKQTIQQSLWLPEAQRENIQS